MPESTDLKGILYVASSLNGLMTKQKTDSSWVADEKIFAKISKDTGCILVGRKTFEQFQESIYPVPETMNIVLTKEKRTSHDKNVCFVNSVESALVKIKELGFKKFIVVGGAQTITECLEQNIINRLYLSLHPYIFSNGLSIVGGFKDNLKLSFQKILHKEENFILLDYSIEETHA